MKSETPLRQLATLFAVLLLFGCGQSEKPRLANDPQPVASQTITTPLGLEMALLPAGGFVMGDDRGDADERPAHKVQVSAFYMDTTEVTQQSYQSLMGTAPAKFQGADRPVERVDWYRVVQYCNMRSLREGLKPCYDLRTLKCDFEADGYRLPTEAEWEYACRAGSTARYAFGDDASKLGDAGWFKANAAGATHPVKQKVPNAWGLHDMHGSVWEWCNDFYAEGYSPGGEARDPRGPAAGDQCVLRGGSWFSGAESCRSASRRGETPRFADACFGSDTYGFRCVRRAPQPTSPAAP
jgi:formylglycine-generating enzyme required for sulfatase activity